MEALLGDQAEMLGRDSPFQSTASSRLRVRILCPRRRCNRSMAEIRDLPAEGRPLGVLVIGLPRNGAADPRSSIEDGAATHWVLVEWPDVPGLIPAYCHGCSGERVLHTVRLRIALRRARRSDHEQTIHADRASGA